MMCYSLETSITQLRHIRSASCFSRGSFLSNSSS